MKKKIVRKRKQKIDTEIKIEDVLLKSRKVFLYGDVNVTSIQAVVKNLLVASGFGNAPIYLFINSPGGSVSDGFALIDTIKSLKSPVYTIVIGHACSMGGLISIAGHQRYMTKNSFWMGHDMSGGIHGDYSGKVEYRADYIKKSWNMIENHLITHTKLTAQDLVTLRNGELWLNPQECLNKGIIDKII
jgi:ATP-dependent Clp protease protease subunit